MSFESSPSHVALLVPSVRKAADHLRRFDFPIGPEEVFEAEGTREIYVGGDRGNPLLLLEPLGSGPYRRALDQRGPGVHHLAVDVRDVEGCISSLAGSGWLLHPASLTTLKRSNTAYLARPGFPALIEVQQRQQLTRRSLFVTEVRLPFDRELTRLVTAVGLAETVRPTTDAPRLSLGGHTLRVEDLL